MPISDLNTKIPDFVTNPTKGPNLKRIIKISGPLGSTHIDLNKIDPFGLSFLKLEEKKPVNNEKTLSENTKKILKLYIIKEPKGRLKKHQKVLPKVCNPFFKTVFLEFNKVILNF